MVHLIDTTVLHWILNYWHHRAQWHKTFFRRNFIAIGVTTVRITRKYTESGVNYAKKSFITLAAGVIIFSYAIEATYSNCSCCFERRKKILAAIHFFKLSSPCGVYYKIIMVIVSGDRNKIIMTIVSDLPLTLASVINYNHKWWHNVEHLRP